VVCPTRSRAWLAGWSVCPEHAGVNWRAKAANTNLAPGEDERLSRQPAPQGGSGRARPQEPCCPTQDPERVASFRKEMSGRRILTLLFLALSWTALGFLIVIPFIETVGKILVALGRLLSG